jgi:trk system potassium uptake protein TrkA
MAQIRRQIVVIGLGRFGLSLARELAERGHEVLGIDRVEALVQAAAEHLTHAVVADGSDERTLEQLGVASFDIGIVGLGQEELASILATMALKRLGLRRVIARSRTDLHGEVLKRIGADQIVYPERDVGYQLAHSFYSPSVLDYIDLGPTIGITKIEVTASLAGMTPAELDLAGDYRLTVVALQRDGLVTELPSADTQLRPGDAIVVMGPDDQLDRFLNRRG